MKFIYKIVLFILVGIFWLISSSFASFVDAGADQIRDQTNMVSLVWSYDWLTGCGLSVIRWSELYIDMPYDLTNAKIYTSDLSLATWWNYEIEVKVNTDGMCDNVSESYSQYRDTMNLCIPNNGFECESSPAPTPSGWSSRRSRMLDQAKKLFKTPDSIQKITLNLQIDSIVQWVLSQLRWNYIWADWIIKYEIEYSNNRDFSWTVLLNKYSKQETKGRSFNIYYNQLNKDSLVHYFRVRANYKDRYSSWSNTVKYVDEKDPLSQYEVICPQCENKITYGDVLYDLNVLLPSEFDIDCHGNCNKKTIDYDDVFDYIFYNPIYKLDTK